MGNQLSSRALRSRLLAPDQCAPRQLLPLAASYGCRFGGPVLGLLFAARSVPSRPVLTAAVAGAGSAESKGGGKAKRTRRWPGRASHPASRPHARASDLGALPEWQHVGRVAARGGGALTCRPW